MSRSKNVRSKPRRLGNKIIVFCEAKNVCSFIEAINILEHDCLGRTEFFV